MSIPQIPSIRHPQPPISLPPLPLPILASQPPHKPRQQDRRRHDHPETNPVPRLVQRRLLTLKHQAGHHAAEIPQPDLRAGRERRLKLAAGIVD